MAQRQFFDYAGSQGAAARPIAPPRGGRSASCLGDRRGDGSIDTAADHEVEFVATATPALVRLRVTVTQREIDCSAEALVTVMDSLEIPLNLTVVNSRGLPGYTFERAAGALWRSRFDAQRNVIVVNNGHRDFVFATNNRALQFRYLARLYVKELVLKNFTGVSAEQLLERMPFASEELAYLKSSVASSRPNSR